MKLEKSIKPVVTDCYCGDIVQYEGKVCLVVKTDTNPLNWHCYGLVALGDGEDGIHVVRGGLSLWMLNKVVDGVLIKWCDLCLSRKDGFDIETMTGVKSADHGDVN